MNLIKELAVSYIKKPSCIILLTVACESMFCLRYETSPSDQRLQPTLSTRVHTGLPGNTILMVIGRSVRWQGHLVWGTFNNGVLTGVLTKPDRIPKTEEENWLPLVRGERGDTLWFCVKCPSTDQINSGITWEEAREKEAKFFSRTAPWSSLDETFKQRLGTGHLTRCLSDKLCDLIAERFVYLVMCLQNNPFPNTCDSLPHIEQELSKVLEKTNQDLEELPPPPSSVPLKEVLRLITDFTRAVERQGEGVPRRDGLLQQIRRPQDEFRLAIRKTAPYFVPRFSKRPIREEPIEDGDMVSPLSPDPSQDL